MLCLWICYVLWESLPTLEAHPVPSTTSLDFNESLRYWELNWLKYSIGLFGITITAFALIGCLCCGRNRRSKGFQDSGGSINKEFKDGMSIENDPSIQQLQGLELQVPTNISLSDRVQFEPLTVERFVPEICVSPRPKPPPPSPSMLEEDNESDQSTLRDSCYEWFQKTDLHVPREKLKYLREIGHGWFGKVIEGCAELQGTNLGKSNVKSGNVVVKILTEEATAKEKAWFLGEATPYFKLRHRNILSLFGSCLETDPFLLLFESCPLGDLKGFLCSNRDPQSRQLLGNENLPTRIAIEIGAGLRHMHEHGLAHTDLSARNCLVASDLSIKLGDYGTGVEKYPGDYYVLGDRALPIRWSAPESVECTDTTIETREITPRANLWSYAVLLWEIATWGERPYNDFGDEKVIEMLLSSKSGMKSVASQLLLQNSSNCAFNLTEAVKSCLVLEPEKRSPWEKVRHILLKDQLEAESSDFEQRWETLRPNISRDQARSASLQDLRGSLDSEQWPSLTQTSFRLGPEEPVKNAPGGLVRSKLPFRDSDSETEEESWRGRVERGVYTEKVKQKSKSVADLMVLVHIEPDSDADLSLGPQMPVMEKNSLMKKRLPATGSDGDLPSAIFDNQFDIALRKLRDPLIPGNSLRGLRAGPASITSDKPKLLPFSMDQRESPILTLNFNLKEPQVVKEDLQQNSATTFQTKITEMTPVQEPLSNKLFCEEKLVEHSPKNDLKHSLTHQSLQIFTNNSKEVRKHEPCLVINKETAISSISNNIQITDLDEDVNKKLEKTNSSLHVAKENLIDGNTWNSELEAILEQKTSDFNSCTSPSTARNTKLTIDEAITPSPQSRAEYSADDVEDEFSNAEELAGLSKRHLLMDEEDDRKRMSTPDDERSSDSGFRDKESCEEEESPLPGPLPNITTSQSNTPKSVAPQDSAEEEQLRVLLELDTILDAECYGTLADSLENAQADNMEVDDSSTNFSQKDIDVETETSETVQSSSEATGETEREIMQMDKSSSDDANLSYSAMDIQTVELETIPTDFSRQTASVSDNTNNVIESVNQSNSWSCLTIADNNEDEDSSTMSLRSDNSYVSFGIDEEFVAAIRNELIEKLPHAQKSVVEPQELHNDDDPSLVSDVDSRNWDEESEEELTERSGVVDISIRYNTYGTPLSPILEERESAGNSESTNFKDDSHDVSTASKGGSNSLMEDDVLFIDTQTNLATLIEGTAGHFNESQQRFKPSYPLDKRYGRNLLSGTGPPLPSPEEDTSKWQQHMLPLELQDNLMSTSFASEQDWDSDVEEGPSETLDNEIDEDEDDDDDDEGDEAALDEDNEDDEDDEETSSSSAEFVWQQYSTSHVHNHETESSKEVEDINDAEDTGEEFETEDEVEEEFTPSAWDATLAPRRSALRSPDKTLKTGDQKKSVWFKKQRYHCVYEYPKETPTIENPTASAWRSTSFTDWEELIDNIDALNFQPMDYFESNSTKRDEEFYVSSSNRPFQFQSGEGKYVSQFFPGASGYSTTETPQERQNLDSQNQQNEESAIGQQRQQLGELRHTRDRLKLNLVTSSSLNGSSKVAQLCNPVKQEIDEHNEDDENIIDIMNSNEISKNEASSIIEGINEQQRSPSKEVVSEITTRSADIHQALIPIKIPSPERQYSSFESKENRDNLDLD